METTEEKKQRGLSEDTLEIITAILLFINRELNIGNRI